MSTAIAFTPGVYGALIGTAPRSQAESASDKKSGIGTGHVGTIDRAMEWADVFPAQDGFELRNRMGPFYVIQSPMGRHWCKFHRYEKTRGDWGGKHWREVDLDLPCERLVWPEGVSPRGPVDAHLPRPSLFDTKQVICVPQSPTFVPAGIYPKEWERLRAAARDGHRAMIRHAYEYTLGSLQLLLKDNLREDLLSPLKAWASRVVPFDLDPTLKNKDGILVPQKVTLHVLGRFLGIQPASVWSIVKRDREHQVRARGSQGRLTSLKRSKTPVISAS